MAPQPMRLYLFGDQTYDILPPLTELLRRRSNPVLQDFLSKAYDAVRADIYRLPSLDRDRLPRFTCLEDIVAHSKSGAPSCIALDMAMTCIYQLGAFISQADHDFNAVGSSCAVGLCTGAFAAAAVSCSRGFLDLVPLALDAVVVAFRVGMLVTDTARHLALSAEPSRSWSHIVSGVDSAQAVRQYCQQTNLPPTSKPYISAFAPSGITVSGPPDALSLLGKSSHFGNLRSRPISVHGPYHAPHLYTKEDAAAILANSVSKTSAERPQCAPLLSSAGHALQGQNFSHLLEAAFNQCLLQPIDWKFILDGLTTLLAQAQPSAFNVVPFGSAANQLLYTALKQTDFHTLLPTPTRAPEASAAPDSTTSTCPNTPKLAIIGMSGRFPGAKDNNAFWDLLHRGLDVHKPVPALHWDSATHVDPTGRRKNTSVTPYGCWLDDPAAFDARFFNISPREAPQIDPAQRLALMTAYEAIEQAGIVSDATPSTRPDRVGVFYGVTSNDWMETNSAQNIDTYFIPGGNRAFIPGRINYCFKFSGPSYAIDTACSSSLAGIHLACNSLWRRDIDTAIAGGTNVLTNPDFTAGLDRGHFLSRTGNCKTFDDEADGYCRGEGIGTVIIKRLDDAIADNDPILGVILGTHTNHSAESESITRPHVGAQHAIFNKVLNQAAVDPYSVSYVEMHGTGTQAGDASEMSSVLETFAPPLSNVKRGRTDSETLHLGSAKANIGHGEAASGISSVIKVLLMMQKNTIVPHCGIKTRINQKFPTDLLDRKVKIALKPIPWTKGNSPRRVFVNNFSAAGGNTALLIEDAPPPSDLTVLPQDPRTTHVVAVSAKNPASLQGNLKSLLAFLRQHPETSLGHLSYTTTARRTHHQHRVMLCASNNDDLCRELETAAAIDTSQMTRPKRAPRVVFTFTGQGAQYPGMGKELFENFSLFRHEICQLDQIATSMGFPSVLPIIQSTEQDIGLFSPTTVQLSNTAMQIALCKLWASWNVTPIAVIGHSLGEYAALNIAGVLSDAEALYLVGKRAQLLEDKCTRNTHAMLVVKASTDEIASALNNQEYETACINSPTETVLAGSNQQIEAIRPFLTDANLKSTLLKVPFAFHSSQIEPILADFEQLAAGVTFREPKIPVVCPLDGRVVESAARFGPDYLVHHSRQPVDMQKALLTARDQKLVNEQSILLEIGPHPAIAGMVRGVLGPQIVSLASSQRSRPLWSTLSTTLRHLYTSGTNILWQNYQQDFKCSHKVISLPSYAWDLKDYWIQYVNDWSLRKGDALPSAFDTPRLESTTIHRIVEQESTASTTRMVVEADIARKDLSPLVQGHEVNGIPLCTPSVYADIALTLGQHLVKTFKPTQPETFVDVSDMTISKALILKAKPGEEQQLLQAHVNADWTSKSATIIFMSFDSKQKLHEHARCVVRYTDRALQDKLQKDLMSTKHKQQVLRDGIASGTTARFNRAMVYRAIRPLARFHDDYRAIDEIVLNSDTLEASSRLSYSSVKRGGDFHTHPAIIDSLTQACGFAMNCNDSTDLDKEVFMNHGWGSLQIFEPMDFDKVYTTYTRMEQGQNNLWYGDAIILDGDKVAAHFGQIAIQGVPRRTLGVILSLESGKKTRPQPVEPAPAVTVSISKPTLLEAGPLKADKALSIIAEESGIALIELSDDTIFADVGVDSLMGLTISSRFSEELDIDIDFNALFFEYPSVASLKTLIGGYPGSSSSESGGSGTSTPLTNHSDTAIPDKAKDGLAPRLLFGQVLQIISEESGVAVSEWSEETDFADAGVDSLLSLVIVSRLQDELDVNIPHESFFLECPTVGHLKRLLVGDAGIVELPPSALPVANASPAPVQKSPVPHEKPILADSAPHLEGEAIILSTRKQAVDALVQKYTAGFKIPSSSPTLRLTDASDDKVVLVTGATGSLGGHLVYHMAQLEGVKTIVCLNRENKAEPYDRQQKAMRSKGIRFPAELKPKLVVLQADASKPMLGLDSAMYEELVGSVTHLVHNAWPMSAKRPLAGFESQFQVMRNLVDFGCQVSSRRPASFKFSFQMVSSVGVVGHYGLDRNEQLTMVPEDRVDIDSVLSNGYSEAKWGCERMLDETLHRHSDKFRTMVVRLGQIAGSKTSGYWNPMEHFGFLVKSSQTLNALPDVPGKVYWTPVNDVAAALSDLVLADNRPHAYYHIENPVGQSWRDMNTVLAEALGIRTMLPFDQWVERVRAGPQRDNPAATLLEFLDSNYLRMSCGGLVLDVTRTLQHSPSLASVGPVSDEVARKYIHIWKEIGFLK